jgi:hypothetical protein
MTMNKMKAFCSAAHSVGLKKNFGTCHNETHLEMCFIPCLTEWNNVLNSLVNAAMILIDESMSGWHPKTSKAG